MKLLTTNLEIQAFLAQVAQAAEPEDAVLVPWHAEWRRGNLVAVAREADEHCMALPREVRESMSGLRAHLHCLSGAPRLRQALAHRSCYCLGREVPQGELEPPLDRLHVVFRAFPDFVGPQLLRAWRNAWPTTLRFGEGPRGCRWGCHAVAGDVLRH